MGKNHFVRIEGHFRTWEEFCTMMQQAKKAFSGDDEWRPFTINGFEFNAFPYSSFCRYDRLKNDMSYSSYLNSYRMSTVSRTSWLGYFGVSVFTEEGYCEFAYHKNAAIKGREPVPENYQDVIAKLTVTIWSLISKDVTIGQAGDTND